MTAGADARRRRALRPTVREPDFEQAILVSPPEQPDQLSPTAALRSLARRTSTSVPNFSGLLALPRARQDFAMARIASAAVLDGLVARPGARGGPRRGPRSRACGPTAARWNDSRVVDDHKRPRRQKLRELSDATVLRGGSGAASSPGEQDEQRASPPALRSVAAR